MNSQKLPIAGVMFDAKTYAGVRQDKSVPLIKRSAMDRGYQRSNTGQSNPNSLVPFTTQVKRFVKSEIHRIARENKISDSAAGSALLERMIQYNADIQYGALLEPIIKNEIKKDIGGYSNRIAYLAVQAYYSAEESRIINTKVLSYLFGDDTEIFKQVVAEARKEARVNIARHTGEGIS
jgi:hypothetical protein